MSFGVGGSDIVTGVKLAWWLYNVGFVEENQADVQFRNFRNEIQGFAQLLQQLDNALDSAHLQFMQRSLAVKATRVAYDPLEDDFATERCRFIGDFTATLEECKALLQQHRNLHTQGSNIFRNVDWKIRTEARVIELRKRIEFHSTKILLVIDRLSLNLLTDIDAKVDDLLGLSEQNLLVSHEIRDLLHNFYNSWKGNTTSRPQILDPNLGDRHLAGPAIRKELLKRAGRHPDKAKGTLDFPKQIPLSEGFDALLFSFEKSLEAGDQTPDHYLCLLKARWLLDNIKLSQEYEDARPGFYYKRAIGRIEQAIRIRVQSNSVIKFDDDTLLALPNSAFDVWHRPAPPSATRYDPTLPRAGEKHIIQLDLVLEDADSKSKVTILQRSDTHFRIVVETHVDDHKEFTDKIYVAAEDKLIPRYALPLLEVHKFEIAIYSRGVEWLYCFRDMNDCFLFQSALMSYDVAHQVGGIKCGFSEGSINNTGYIQIWQDPIKSSQSPSSMPSLTLTRSGSTAASDLYTGRSSIASSVAATTVSRVSDGYQARPIAFPAITIFTEMPDRHGRMRLALLYLKLDADIKPDLEKCGCGDEATYASCPILSIERPKRAKFPVYVLYSALDTSGLSDPNTWDLSPFRIPEHPCFKQLRRVDTNYLLLHFPSRAKKKAFHQELNDRLLLREAQRLEQDRFFANMLYRQNKPSRVAGNILQPQSHSRSTSFGSAAIDETSVRTQLKALDLGADFQASFGKTYTVQGADDRVNDDNRQAPSTPDIVQRHVTNQSPTPVSNSSNPSSKKRFKWTLRKG